MKPYIFILISFLLIGCKEQPALEQDSAINPGDMQTIKQYARNIVEAIEAKKSDKMISFLSKDLKKKTSTIDSMLFDLNLTKTQTFDLAHFRIVNTKNTNINTVHSEVGMFRYYIHFNPPGKETYIHLFSIQDANSEIAYLISAMYVKNWGDWELTSFFTGNYSFKNKVSPQLYEKAIGFYKYGYLIPAYYYALLAKSCLNPMPAGFSWDGQDEISNFYEKNIVAEMTEQRYVPKVMSSIATRPEILALEPSLYNGRILPKIFYKTNIDIDDTVHLQMESYLINKEINKVFPGFYVVSDTLLYEALDKYNYSTARHMLFEQLVDKYARDKDMMEAYKPDVVNEL